MKKTKSAPKSRSKTPPKKKSPAPKARPAPPPKRAPGTRPKGDKKKGAKPTAPSSMATEAAPAPTPPVVPAQPVASLPTRPRAPARVEDDDDLGDEDHLEISGEAIDGKRFASAIQYAAKVTPKDAEVVFTLDPQGVPLISGHDKNRCHTAFLAQKAAFHLSSSVPRIDAIKLAKALEGLAAPMVRVGRDGEVLIRHGIAQPPMRFRLGVRAITQAWEPPSQSGREAAVGSLKINAAWQSAACRWSHATVHAWQSRDGIEWLTLKDEHTGELLGRAVLAEAGKDLYAEDDRQTELPGSRTAGRSHFDRAVEGMGAPIGGGVVGAVRDLTRTLHQAGATMTVTTGDGRSATLGGGAPDRADQPVVCIDGQPVTDASVDGAEGIAAPSVARQWVEASAWDALSAEARAAFESVEVEGPDGAAASAHITWERRGDFVTTEVSEALAEILWDAAVEADVDLHEGPEPPTRVWVAEAAWNDLGEAATEALSEPVPGTRLAIEGRDGFVTALVPAAAFGALERLSDEHDVTLHLGAEPPATNTARFG